MAIYLKYGKIKGDATHDAHKEWIEVHSLQWGVGRGISTPVGAAANREASEPSVSEVTISKTADAASTSLFQAACTGAQGEELEIHLVTTGSPGDTYMELKLANSLISGYSFSSGGDSPSESVSFNFTKISYKHTLYDDKHKVKTSITEGYDLATAKKV